MSNKDFSFCLGFVAMVIGAFMAPTQFVWVTVVAIGILSGLVGVAYSISEKKS